VDEIINDVGGNQGRSTAFERMMADGKAGKCRWQETGPGGSLCMGDVCRAAGYAEKLIDRGLSLLW